MGSSLVEKPVRYTIIGTVNGAILIPASSPRWLRLTFQHGCLILPVSWAGPGSRYTLLVEAFVISWLKISTVDAVRRQLKLSWHAVDNIMQRAVKRALARLRLLRSKARGYRNRERFKVAVCSIMAG